MRAPPVLRFDVLSKRYSCLVFSSYSVAWLLFSSYDLLVLSHNRTPVPGHTPKILKLAIGFAKAEAMRIDIKQMSEIEIHFLTSKHERHNCLVKSAENDCAEYTNCRTVEQCRSALATMPSRTGILKRHDRRGCYLRSHLAPRRHVLYGSPPSFELPGQAPGVEPAGGGAPLDG